MRSVPSRVKLWHPAVPWGMIPPYKPPTSFRQVLRESSPFWRAVQLRINEKRPWYQDALDWMRGVLPASRLAWVVPAVIGLLLAGVSLESYWRGGAGRNAFATVESIDAYGRNVALLREYDTKTTVIWLYQDQEGENESAEETAPSGPAF